MLTHAPAPSSDAIDDDESSSPAAVRAAAASSLAFRVTGQLDRYARSLLWVVRDALPRWKGQVAAIVVCNLLGLGATLAAVGGVMAYARAAEHRKPMHLLGRSYQISGDVVSLIEFGAIIALLGAVSAACIFIADRLILALARQYHTLCADRAMAIAADPMCRGWQVMSDDPPRAILLRMVGSASRAMALVLRDLLRIILPALAVTLTVGFLFYIDSMLTLILLPAAALYVLPLYAINRRVTRMQRTYRQLSPQARSEVGRRLREMLNSGELVERPEAAMAFRRDALQGPAWRDALAALYGRLLADRRVHLLNAAFFIICLVTILVFFGVRAKEEGRPWSDLIFYLLALRYAMTALKQTTALGAKFSRFFPEYHAYATFVTESEWARERRTRALSEPRDAAASLTIRLGKNTKWGSIRALRLPARATLFVLTPTSPGFVDLEAALLRVEARLDEAVDWSSHAAFIVQADRLMSLQPLSNQAVVVAASPADRPRAASWWKSPAAEVPPLLMIVGDDPAACASLAAATNRPAWAVVIEDHRIVAGGDLAWLDSNREAIANSLRQHAERLRARGGSDDGMDDDDDEGEE